MVKHGPAAPHFDRQETRSRARAASQPHTDRAACLVAASESRDPRLKFRRQHVLHGFIVDFYCAELRLVLELDGDHHREPSRAGYDAARSQCLVAAGYHVIRIKNRELTRERIIEAIRSLSSLEERRHEL